MAEAILKLYEQGVSVVQKQGESEGKQYFAMHYRLRNRLERHLQNSDGSKMCEFVRADRILPKSGGHLPAIV